MLDMGKIVICVARRRRGKTAQNVLYHVRHGPWTALIEECSCFAALPKMDRLRTYISLRHSSESHPLLPKYCSINDLGLQAW